MSSHVRTAECGGAAPLPGLLADRYRLEHLLGIGGMSNVYAARDLLREGLGDPEPVIAVKLLSDEFAAYPDANALLHAEFALTVRLRHTHIVRAHGFEVDPTCGRAFITQEWMHGLTLDRLLIERPNGLPYHEYLQIADAMLDALAHVHAAGIVHGDLKPSNLMLCEDGLRLFDFGLARATNVPLSGLPTLSRKRFDAWTPNYAALELLEDNQPTPASDLFAGACVLHELLTGEHPYPRLATRQKPALRLERQLSRPPHLHREGWNALRTALALNREDRGISAVQLREALRVRGSRLP